MKNKIYLPGLNGIRAIAALSVILAHSEKFLASVSSNNYFGNFGGYGVTIFFTLSGFLITYLMLKEIEKETFIDIKKFYIRRILRIWPLYFFYFYIVLIIMKFQVSFNVLYYVFFIPNVPFAIQLTTGSIATIPLLLPYWSLGVEEQFYLIWPWIIKFSKNIKRTLILFCAGYFLLKVVLTLVHAPPLIQAILYNTRFSCLSIGAIGAYLFYEKNNYILILNKKWIELSSWAILALFFTNYLRLFSIINHEIISVLSLIIIFNQINNTKPLIYLENKWFDYLGKISFGLYVYNLIVIEYLNKLMLFAHLEKNYWFVFIFILLSAFITIVVSHLSYNYFENRFLKLKIKYITVESAASKSESEN
jgi:peptidoglycan/LPS O-acetylase OafA/YrhL